MKTVVITGSTRGIGRGLAENFLRRGQQVVVSGRDQAAVAVAVGELGEQFDPARVAGAACEVTDLASLQGLWQKAAEHFGPVDVWINNAGLDIPHRPLWEAEADDLRRVVDTNLTGVLLASKVAMTGMKAQGHGQVWNMEGFGSNGMSQAGLAPYGATKRAVNYLNTALRKDAAGTGIQVCTLSPGIVLTDMLLQDMDTGSEDWPRVRRVFNILADTVDTVTPWLVDRVLKADRDGAKVMWLTGPKIGLRFLTARFRKRDLFSEFGM
jgi:NAD(P)-dependent dehydrogenase (short-subunit alcohol dehydrogenase family)